MDLIYKELSDQMNPGHIYLHSLLENGEISWA